MIRLSYWVRRQDFTPSTSIPHQSSPHRPSLPPPANPPLQVIPILAGTVWLAMLLALLLYWVVDTHETHYGSMDATQRIAYISDVGAAELKPLFIAGCVITTVLLDLSFGLDRWLRHKGRLAPNTTTAEKVLSGLTIAFAVVGTVGLILLSIFDTARYPRLHDIFLLLFIAGYVLSAIFICWEYQRLGMRAPFHFIPPFPFIFFISFRSR
jgi:hypothetical protein